MDPTFALTSVSLAALAASLPRLHRRLMLSRAKHRSLAGHSRLAKRIAGLIPGYAYDEQRFFAADDAPPDVVGAPREGLERRCAR